MPLHGEFDQLLLASSEGCGIHLRMRAILTGTRLYYSMLLVVFSHDCDIKHTCIQRIIFFRQSFFLYSPCHCVGAWIRVLDAPSCYEHVARAERKSALQGSGLIRTVGPCSQRRVALLMPRAIATARDALSIERSARKRRAF